MSIDSPSNSNSPSVSPSEVVSKYFTTKSGMDESLSDFQEKKNFIGTRNTKKPSVTNKVKKAPKKLKGQKDIRTVIKSKKNELISYSNDFDKICKKSGINVDSEQLQLAIALSKSLHRSDNSTNNDLMSSGSLSTQERTGRIRTTLQEYGFVVPEIKITGRKSRKLKKNKKDYKLLLATETEKQQIISDKYSQVLFSNLDNSKPTTFKDSLDNSSIELYQIVTKITYKEIKDNKLFYVEGLVEENTNNIGSLLKDWSEIPGRPFSPILETVKLHFTEIDCTQEELDTILSGTLKSAQYIARDKYNLLSQNQTNPAENKVIIDQKAMDHDSDKLQSSYETVKVIINELNCKENVVDVIGTKTENFLTVTNNVRSCSPDIFDDEVSTVLNISEHDETSQALPNRNITKVCDEVMDLTEYVIVNTRNSLTNSQLSHGINVTKRKSNDFMEITECAAVSSQPIRENIIEENIDLTQNSDDENEVTIVTGNDEIKIKKDVVNMDITQSSDSSDELPLVQISGKKCMDDTIILNDEEYAVVESQNRNLKENAAEVDINESNKDTSKLVPKSISGDEIDEEIIITIKHIDDENLRSNTVRSKAIQDERLTDKFVLTEDKSNTLKSEENIKSRTESFFEEFVHLHSESSEENSHELDLNNIDNCNVGEYSQNKSCDTTQTESEENNSCLESPQALDTSSLGKIGNISIDYDDMFDNIVKHTSTDSQIISTPSRSNAANNKPSYASDLVSNSSQNSEVFEISDHELDYSLRKSTLGVDTPKENFDFGGISLIDNLPDVPSLRKSYNLENRSLNRSLSDGYMPVVDIKSTKDTPIKSCKSLSTSPNKACIIAKTPKNCEYIIKTDQVTPMMDYAAMTTPERNAELDKYGLKPFKRKRAIQMLTHLYNQTHPVVESCSELPSLSKKLKPNSELSPKKVMSQKKIKSPQSSSSEKDHKEVIEDEHYIYEVTTEVPDIRDIACSEDEWVFQKREKSKIHSCRVPLHIAFHNYVFSRVRLREAILRYEPVNIDVIHKGLVANGCRYDPKDLLKFMDKKCITVKTSENNSRNNKKHY